MRSVRRSSRSSGRSKNRFASSEASPQTAKPASVARHRAHNQQHSGPETRSAQSVSWNVAAGENIRWRIAIPGRAHSSPIVWGDRLFLTTAVSSEGEKPFRPGIYDDVASTLTCYRARSGERLYRRRIGGYGGVFTASPVAGDGKLYLASEEGGIHVVTAGPSYRLLATNPMGEVLLATPAISEGVVYVRSMEHLYGIGEHQPLRPQRGPKEAGETPALPAKSRSGAPKDARAPAPIRTGSPGESDPTQRETEDQCRSCIDRVYDSDRNGLGSHLTVPISGRAPGRTSTWALGRRSISRPCRGGISISTSTSIDKKEASNVAGDPFLVD